MLGITADGVFGQQTLHALRVYQRHFGLDVTGTTTEQTWRTLGTHGPLGSVPGQNQSVAQIISNVAQSLGIPPEVALSLGLYESGLDPKRVGDQGTSFGIYQLHEGGELGSHDANWAFNVRNNAETALGEMARIHAEHPNLNWGQVAAAAQRPADPGAEAAAVNRTVQAYRSSGQAPVAYFTSHSAAQASGGSAGQASGNFSGAGPGKAQLSPSDIAASLDQLGFAKALINSDPSLKQAFNEIVSRQIDVGTSAGRAEAMALIKNTQWWTSRSASQRKFDEMAADKSQRADLQQMLKQKRGDLEVMAEQLGIPLDPQSMAKLATAALRNNLDDNQLNKIFSQHLNYKPGQSLSGQAGLDLTGLQKLASSYYVRMGNNELNGMLQRMIAGGLTPDAMVDFFKQQALSRFPHLQKQINSGLTVADIASPYVQAMGQILEQDPNGIKPMDPTIMKALQQPDGNGGFQLMPEWQFEQTLRQDPRWLKTNNARQDLLGIGHDLLKSFGVAV